MSRKAKIKHMSFDELKAKLHAHFQKSGTFDHLRAQVRGELVSELFKIAEPVDSDKFPKACDFEKCILPLQVCNWLVYDHLSRHDYQYSLSTFVAEAQLPYPEKLLTAGDVLGLLGFKNAKDSENINILYSKNNELGILHSLLLAIVKTMFSKVLPSDTNQIVNSEKRLKNEQKELTQNSMQNKSSVSADIYIQDLPQFEQTNVNKSYLTDDNAKSTEVSFFEQFQSFKEDKEKEVQTMRYRLFEELNDLQSQKRKMSIDLEQTKSELKKEQSKLLKEKEMLKEKGILLEKELTNQFEMQVRNIQSEFAEKLHFKDKEIESLKRKLSEKDEKLMYLQIEVTSEKDNNSLMKQELNDLESRNKIIQDKYSAALDQNTNLLRKFENMSDYSLVKDELAIKSREINRLQNEIKDLYQKSEAERRKYVETVRNLENNLSVKEPQIIQAKQELDDMRNSVKRERAVWNRERKKFEDELRELKVNYETETQKLEEKNEEVEDLRHTINILNYKLTNTVINQNQKKAFTKLDSIGLYKHYQKPVDSQKNYPGILFAKRNTSFQQQSEKDYDSRFKFVSDKKNVFGTLGKEENSVREKYSTILGSVPDPNKQMSYSRNYKFLPLPKKYTDSYNEFYKPVSASLSFNYDKSKLSTVTKPTDASYDIRQMVTHSLSPYNGSKEVDSPSNFAASSQMSNFIDTKLKDTWKVPKLNNFYNFHKQYDVAEINDNTSVLNTVRYESSLNKDNTIPEKSLYLSSQHNNADENQKLTPSSEKQNREVTMGNNIEDNFEENNESIRKINLDMNPKETSSDQNNTISSTIFQNRKTISEQENISSQNLTSAEQAQTLLVHSNRNSHNVTSNIVENKPESTVSVSANLDNAWKIKTPLPSLSYSQDRHNETRFKDESDNSLCLNSRTSNNRTTDNIKQSIFEGNIGKTIEIGSEDAFNKSVENTIDKSAENVLSKVTESVNNPYEESYSKNAPNLPSGDIKNTSDNLHIEHMPLCDKSARNIDTDTAECTLVDASSKLQTLSEKDIKSSIDAEEKPSVNEIEQMDSTINKEEEETIQSQKEDIRKTSDGDDSVSEQSELHFSCGSVTEQQKEDSDGW